jgi:hypothetical protein
MLPCDVGWCKRQEQMPKIGVEHFSRIRFSAGLHVVVFLSADNNMCPQFFLQRSYHTNAMDEPSRNAC